MASGSGIVSGVGRSSKARLKAGVLAGALAVAGAFAVPLALTAQDYAFSNVVIQGNARVEPQTILTYAGIARGKTVSAAQLNDAYQRLVNSGLFEAVEIVPQGSTLVIKVTEYPTISVISVEGNKRIKDEEILAAIQSKPRRIYSPSVAEQDTTTIVGLYSSRGRLAATVTPKIIRRSENRVDLVFEVTEGKPVEIQRLAFVGNRAYSESRLRRVLATKQAGILHQIIQRDSFTPERLELDKQLLRDFYLSRGYIDFRVKSVSTEYSRERDATFLTFDLQEGRAYKFGKLTVTSDLPEIEIAEYQKQLKIRSGATYTPTLVDNTISRMEGLAQREGLTFVRVTPNVTKNASDGTVDIQFSIERGPRIFVERIDIQGNQTTLDRVIRTQFRTSEGDPFNPREIREAAERIRALGFFSNADVQARQGSAEDQVIVDVNVAEQNTGSLSLGGTYSQDGGFGVAISLSESNFLGRGQGVRFVINTTSGSQSYAFNFSEPNLLGRDLMGRINLSYYTTDYYNADYSTEVGTFSPQLEFPISEYGRLNVRYTLAYSRIFSVDNDSSIILKREADKGAEWQSSLGYSYIYDTRKTGLNPLGGNYLRFSQDIGGLGGTLSFLKTTATATSERKVMNEDVTLRATFEGGALHHIGSGSSRVTDRFMLSSQQLRGFEYAGLGPRDNAVSNEDPLGGNFYAIARFESEFPLGLPEEYGISGGAFMDFGTLWGLDDTNGGATGANPVDDSAHLRASIGVSVFWTTPLGPLRFNFAKALKKEDYDKTRVFDLSVSTQF